MKIPKSIEKIIERRAKLAMDLNATDCTLAQWLKRNDITVEEFDIHGGCEMYVNPWSSADRIKKAIENK